MTNIEARFLHDDQHWEIDISAYDWNHRLDLICKVSEKLDKKIFLKNLSEEAKTWLFDAFFLVFPILTNIKARFLQDDQHWGSETSDDDRNHRIDLISKV